MIVAGLGYERWSMVESWGRPVHRLSFVIDLDPREARAIMHGGNYGVRQVTVEYRRTGGDGWEEPRVLLDGLITPAELDEVPQWLDGILARTRPMDP